MKLKIADNLTLPLDFVTERIAFLARTGAGKSGGMRVLAEEMIEAGQFVVQLDLRAGDAWGIRGSGIGPGYPVLVMGGEHAQVPLQPTAGKVVADFLVRDRVNTVIDISDFTKADATRFVTAFAERFYTVNRDVVHLFIDEIDVVAGERFFDPHCLESIQYLQTKGRKRGIGVTISTQRTAIVNKTVLSQAGTLIAMQATAPRDLKAVREYLEYVAEKEIVDQIIGELPTLKQREAFVYSPQFIGGEPRRITFNSFRTFDSMRTPRPGEVRQKPKKLADIDLSAVQRDMAETIERAKAEDPNELRKKITDLQQQLTAKPVAQADTAALDRSVAAAVKRRDGEWQTALKERDGIITGLTSRMGKAAALLQVNGQAIPKAAPPERAVIVAALKSAPAAVVRKPSVKAESDDSKLPKGERAILARLIQYPDGLLRKQLTTLSKYKRSTRDAYIQRLSEKGYVGFSGDKIVATDEGRVALPDYEPLPTGEALREFWFGRLPEGERVLFEQIVAAYPNEIDRDQLTETTGYKRSTRDAYLQRMAAKEIIERGRGPVKASADLFE